MHLRRQAIRLTLEQISILMHNLLLRWVHKLLKELLLRVSTIYEFSFFGMPHLFFIKSVWHSENKKFTRAITEPEGCQKTTNSIYYFDLKNHLIITKCDFDHRTAKSEIIPHSIIKIIHI
jgi:hypothetical protein